MKSYILKLRDRIMRFGNGDWQVMGFLFLLLGTIAPTGLSEDKAPPEVTIYEVCVTPGTVGSPRWVEIRSVSNGGLNLKGYSLHDRSGCFYEFTTDCLLPARKEVVLCFYSNRAFSVNVEAGDQRERAEGSRIQVFGLQPFAYRSHVVAPQAYWDEQMKYEAIASNDLEIVTLEQYQYLERLATEYLNGTGFDSRFKVVAMSQFHRLRLESDEVALVDPNGQLVSYVGWGGIPPLENLPKTKWEETATKAGLWHYRETIACVESTDTIFKYPEVVLERAGPTWFARMPFGTPGESQCKEVIKGLTVQLDKKTGWPLARAAARSSNDSWNFVLEMSWRTDFRDVIYRKEKETRWMPWLEPPVMTALDMTDEQIRALCKYPRWYYRARREFNDGDYTDWTKGEAPIDRNAWLGEFGDVHNPATLAEGWIEFRRKQAESKKPAPSSESPAPHPAPEHD